MLYTLRNCAKKLPYVLGAAAKISTQVVVTISDHFTKTTSVIKGFSPQKVNAIVQEAFQKQLPSGVEMIDSNVVKGAEDVVLTIGGASLLKSLVPSIQSI